MGITRPVKGAHVVPLYLRINATFLNKDLHFIRRRVGLHDIFNRDVQRFAANWNKTGQDSVIRC